MLSGFTAILSCQKCNEFGISERNRTAVCGSTIQSHLQCLSAAVDDLTISCAKLTVLRIQIQTEGTGNHRIIKRMNGAFKILNDFFCRCEGLFSDGLIIDRCACAGNGTTRVHRKCNGHSGISVNFNCNIGSLFFILHIVGLLSRFISVLRNTVYRSGLNHSCYNSHRNRLVCVIRNRSNNFVFFLDRRYRKHISGYTR